MPSRPWSIKGGRGPLLKGLPILSLLGYTNFVLCYFSEVFCLGLATSFLIFFILLWSEAGEWRSYGGEALIGLPLLFPYLSPRCLSADSRGCLCPWKACLLPAEAPSRCLRCLCVCIASPCPFGLSPARGRIVSSSVHTNIFIYKYKFA